MPAKQAAPVIFTQSLFPTLRPFLPISVTNPGPDMNPTRSILAIALVAVAAIPAAHAEIAIGSFAGSEVGFEGLVQTDGYWYHSDRIDLDADDGDGKDTDFGLRRSELVLKGKGPGNFDWVLGYDASGTGKFLDANIAYRIGGSKANKIVVGQFKQPNSLEELSSTRNNDFIAKAAITNAFGVSRRLGASWTYGSDSWGTTVAAFGRELTRNRAHGSGYGLRGYWAPINAKGSILHLGLSYVDHDTDADTVRLRARPDADLSNRIIDTGSLEDTDRLSTLGAEGFWVRGPFKLQGEYMRTRVKRYGGSGDFSGDGGYISGIWNVTGETWSYKNGTPGTPQPAEPTAGMWQLGLRYDALDLDDGAVRGGRMQTWTAGVNWYWRSNFRLSLDYVKASSRRLGSSDNPDIVEARAQFHW